MKSIIKLIFLTLITFTACSKKNEPNVENEIKKVTLEGHVEKGPFVRGSTLIVYELNDQFVPTGKSFKTEILDDKGSFNLKAIEISSKYVQITASGYYFDEITAQLSKSTISLNAIAEVNSEKTININVLTHLEEKRVRNLIKEGKEFTEAKLQAQKEIYKLFDVKGNVNIASSENISFTQNNVNSTVLLGISAALLHISESNEAKLTELLSTLSQDLEDDGVLSENNIQKVKQGLEGVNGEVLNSNIKLRYDDLGVDMDEFVFTEVFESGFEGTYDVIVPWEPTIEDINNALYGALINQIKYSQNYFFLEGLYTNTINDAAIINSYYYNKYYNHLLDGNDGSLSTIFANIYKSIRQYNYIVNYSSKLNPSKELTLIKNKAIILQAYAYWQWIIFFGDPFYLTPDNFDNDDFAIPRTNKAIVIRDLIKNLEVSIQELTSEDDKMADFGKLLASKFYLELGDINKANSLIHQIITSNTYSLSGKNDIFNTTNEFVFSNGFNLDNVQDQDINFTLYTKKGKYLSFGRFTEVLLLAAEVNLKLKNTTKALEYLNLVRERNGKEKLSSREDILDHIHVEYKEDLKNEGVYFSFLKRNNLAKNTLKIEEFKQVFPIPRREMDMNPNATQNMGY